MKFSKLKIISGIWDYGAFFLLVAIIFLQRFILIPDIFLFMGIIGILIFTFMGEYVITPYFLLRKEIFVGEIIVPFGRKMLKISIDGPITWESIEDVREINEIKTDIKRNNHKKKKTGNRTATGL